MKIYILKMIREINRSADDARSAYLVDNIKVFTKSYGIKEK
jgi:hypothetical protein